MVTGAASDDIAPPWRRATYAAESFGARETERDRICSSDAGAIDAAEGGPALGGVSPLYYLASCVCLLEPAPSL